MSWCIAWRYSNSFLLQNLPRETPSLSTSSIIMSDKCADCTCNDPSKCTKKGSSYAADIVETEKSSTAYTATIVMDDSFAENDGKCKCGPSCACTNCTCGSA